MKRDNFQSKINPKLDPKEREWKGKHIQIREHYSLKKKKKRTLGLVY